MTEAKKWYQTKIGVVFIWIIALALYPVGIPFLIIWYTRKNPKMSDTAKKVIAGFSVVLGIALAATYSTEPQTGSQADSTNKNIQNQEAKSEDDQVPEVKTEESLKEKIVDTTKLIDGYKNYDPSGKSKEELLLSVAAFNGTAKLVQQGKADADSEVVDLAKKLESTLISVQVKQFPLIRQAYGKIFKEVMWEHDIDVAIKGSGNTTIEFVGGFFAANKNIKDTHITISDSLKELRFKRVNYKWFEYDDNYTYFELDSLKDGELAIE